MHITSLSRPLIYPIIVLTIIVALHSSIVKVQAQTPPGWTPDEIVYDAGEDNVVEPIVKTVANPYGYHGVLFLVANAIGRSDYRAKLQIYLGGGTPPPPVMLSSAPTIPSVVPGYRDLALLADMDGFYAIWTEATAPQEGHGVVYAGKIDFSGEVPYRTQVLVGEQSKEYVHTTAAFASDDDLMIITTTFDWDTLESRLYFLRINKNTGAIVQLLTPIVLANQGNRIINTLHAASDPLGNVYVLLTLLQPMGDEQLVMLKLDPQGVPLYSRELSFHPRARAQSVAYKDGKVHIAWDSYTAPPGASRFFVSSQPYYAQLDARTGDIVLQAQAIDTHESIIMKPSLAVDPNKVVISYLVGPLGLAWSYYTTIHPSTGNVIVPPTRFASTEVETVDATAVTTDDIRTYLARVHWRYDGAQGFKVIKNVYRPNE